MVVKIAEYERPVCEYCSRSIASGVKRKGATELPRFCSYDHGINMQPEYTAQGRATSQASA